MNSYNQLKMIRDLIGEATASHWSDRELLGYLNASQSFLGRKIQLANVGWLVKSASVTPVASVITLPSDCAKPIYLEETSSGRPIPIAGDVMDRRVTRLAGTTLYSGVTEAYRQMNALVVNSDNYTEACTLWYQIRVPDLHVGTASAGAATSITLSAHDGAGVSSGGFGARQVVDYYNGAQIEIVSGTGLGTDTISDYAATKVATVTGTYSTDSVYGTISRLPEESHHLMWLDAAMIALAKPGAELDPSYFKFMKVLRDEAVDEFEDWIATHSVAAMSSRSTELWE